MALIVLGLGDDPDFHALQRAVGRQGAAAVNQSGVNGIAGTVASLNTGAQTFTLNGVTATGTCTANTGGLVRNANPPQLSNQTGVWLVDGRAISTTGAVTVTRLPNSRAFVMYGEYQHCCNPPINGQYYQEAHCTISSDATLSVCSSGSLPDTIQVISMATGFSAANNPIGYSYYRTITIDHTKVASAQTNFPMLFNVTDSSLKSAANGGHVMNADGHDIIFTSDAAGTNKLDHEIESYNPNTGQFIAWVGIPTLSNTSDTVIYMFYGNSNITTSQENIRGVWDSNYLGVWHWKNGTTLIPTDSTSNANGATVVGTVNPGIGVIDGGASFNGNGGNSLVANATPINSLNTMTFSGWINTASSSTTQALIDVNSDYILELNSAGQPNFTIATTGSYRGATAESAISTNAWHYIVGTISSADNLPHLYVDGSEVSYSNQSVGSGSNSNSGTYLTFGANGENPYSYMVTGTLDEERVSNSVRSASWIATEYNNQNSPSTFITLGSEQ